MKCVGSGHLPRVIGEVGTGLCISCQEFRPMYEIIPPSKPEWRREFRLIDHDV